MTRNATSAEVRAALARAFYAEKKPANATPSRTYVNSAMGGSYTGSGMQSPRSDADAHLAFTSKGF